MAKYRPLRARRYESLRKSGFTKWEAREYSKVPRTTPYLKDMIADREEDYGKFKRQRKNKGLEFEELDKRWNTKVKRSYTAKGRGLHLGKGKRTRRWEFSAFSNLRDYEDDYKARDKNYVSPWKPKQKDYQAEVRRTERTLKAQQKKQNMQGSKPYG